MRYIFDIFKNALLRKNISFFSIVYNTISLKESKIYRFSKISNSKIGRFSYISPFAVINNCEIGNFCSISMNVKIGLGNHPVSFISTSPIFYSKKNALGFSFSNNNCFNEEYKRILIGNDVWIGANVVIMDGISIGNGAIVGAGSVVTKNVDDYAIVGGTPAKVIRYRFENDIIKELLRLEWWNWDTSEIKKKVHLFQQVINNMELIEKLS